MRNEVERKIRAYRRARHLVVTLNLYYPELADATLPQIVARLAPARHSPDFRCAAWFGKDYCFSPSQAVIVRELWKAWRNGTPFVGAAALLEAADMVSDKISQTFRDSPAWGTMIRTDGHGIYWLHFHEDGDAISAESPQNTPLKRPAK